MFLNILYEDDQLIAVNKPEGVASISENDLSISTIQSLLEKKFNSQVFIVHILDKEVSGVILFAKTARAHKLLNEQFRQRIVDKKYIALVSGTPSEKSGTIKKPIKQFGSGRMGVDKSGKESITNYKVTESFGNYSLIELNPSTGRRHQLRVHLYSIGFPIIGDLRYGDKEFQKQFQRLMLHAKSIEFTGLDGTSKHVEADLPDTFIKQIEILK